MKSILVILDGLSEKKLNTLNNKTPLEYAYTPNLDKIIQNGTYEKKKFYLEDRPPDSLSCILSLLGVNKNDIPKNRAYLEALSKGIEVSEDEVVLRCNLISIKDNMLESFNGYGLNSSEMLKISKDIKTLEAINFFHLGDYRNIITVKRDTKILSLNSMPPHENLGIAKEMLLKQVSKISILNEFIKENSFEKNNKQYMFYPWGVSEKINLPSFYSLYNKDCACICKADIMKGIARAMNMNIPVLKQATGDIDTNLIEKADAVINEIKTHDVVIAHINGTDEASHRKDLHGKINFIEKIDREFIERINNISDIKLIILSDHQTSSITGKHEKGFVDYICNLKEE